MADLSAAQAIALIGSYGYWAIIPLSILVGPLIAIIAGVLVSVGSMNPYVAFVALMAADTIGDGLYYLLGYFARRDLFRRFDRFLGLTPERLAVFERKFARDGWKILTFGKTQIAGLPTGHVILAAAGFAKMPFWPYLWYNTLGSLPKVLFFEWFGYYFANVFIGASSSLFDYLAISSLAFLIAVLGYVGFRSKPFFADEARDAGTV